LKAPGGTKAHGLFSSALRVFAGEALALPSGVLVTAFLARRLEPEGFGVFALATAIVVWVEWGVASLFSRQTVRQVASAEDWRPVAGAALRLSLLLGGLAAAALAAASPWLARALEAPDLAACLVLYSLEVPLFSAARAGRSVLIGIEGFGERGRVAASRWIARLVLIDLFVWAGAGLKGAVAGSVGAAAVELLLCWRRLGLSRGGGSRFPAAALLKDAPSFFTSAASLRLYTRLDLFLLKSLGGSIAQAGAYGAAQAVAALPNLAGASFTTPLMGALTRLRCSGRDAEARALLRAALRATLCLLPLAGVVAGSAEDVALFLFGGRFAESATPLALLSAGSFALLLLSVATSALTAADRPRAVLGLTAPLVLLAGGAQLFVIPRMWLAGAALVTCTVAWLGAAAGLVSVYRTWGVLPPPGTLWRAAAVTCITYVAAVCWPAKGWLLPLEMAAETVGAALLFVVLSEFSRGELAAAVRAVLGRPGAGTLSGRDERADSPAAGGEAGGSAGETRR